MKSCCRAFAKHYETGEVLPAEIIRKMKTAGAFGRADWVRTQLYYTTLSLDLHDQDPAGIDLDEITKRLYTSLHAVDVARGEPDVCELRPPDGLLVELLHLCVRQGDCAGLFCAVRSCGSAGRRCGRTVRKLVLEQGGSKPGREMVRDFLGRDEEFAAFTKWLNEEFEGELVGAFEMNAGDFRRIALSLEGAEEGSHMGQADFRVGGRIFATLAAEKRVTGI